MSLKARLKRERRKRREKLTAFKVGSLVQVTHDLPFAPAGIYQSAQVHNSMLCLKTGSYWFAIGDMYLDYLKPIESSNETYLTDEQICIAYANAAIERLSQQGIACQ